MAKKKPNKERRMQLRAQHAEIYQDGFEHRYKLGFEVAKAEHERGKEHGQQILSQAIAETGKVPC